MTISEETTLGRLPGAAPGWEARRCRGLSTRGCPFTDWTLSRTEHGHSCGSAAWQGLMATLPVSLGGAYLFKHWEAPDPWTHMWSRFQVLKRTRLSRLP